MAGDTTSAWAQLVATPSMFQTSKQMLPGFMNGSEVYGNLPFMISKHRVFEPTWTVGVGAVWLDRSRPASGRGHLALDGASVPRLAVDQLDPQWEMAPELSLTWNLHNGWKVGYTYFGVDDWDAAIGVAAPGDLYVPLFNNDTAMDDVRAALNSRLSSHQINATFGGPTTWIRPVVGLRFLQVFDDARLEAWGPSSSGVVDFGTRNQLYGPQTGVEIELWPRGLGNFELGGLLQIGLLGARISASTATSGDIAPPIIGGRTNHLTFLGEAGLTAKYRFTDHLAVYAGYNVLYLAGVADAWDVYTALDPGRQMKRGCPFYHGGRFGLEFRW